MEKKNQNKKNHLEHKYNYNQILKNILSRAHMTLFDLGN